MGAPNVLFLMCDQLRSDTFAAMGNSIIKTPNIDRLVERGVVFTNAYSSCPICIPARYTIRTGREPYNTGIYVNSGIPDLVDGQAEGMEDRCGSYLARTMAGLGYRTFGVGKFHSKPWDEELGYEVHLHSEELYHSKEQRRGDAYARHLMENHPEFNFIEQPHGERTEMYYMPQMSPLPAGLTVESWAADRAVEQINSRDGRPYFGFVSFIGPHPPFAPPVPFNRMYNPDLMPDPVRGCTEVDHMDEQIPFMNYQMWSEEINDPRARVLKARYYAEISYIDSCIGKILDAVEKGPAPDNTLICFFSDHGDHMGDHNGWQKESFFESSCKVPFILSWPRSIRSGAASGELVSLVDLFGIATSAAGCSELRDGVDVIGLLNCGAEPRNYLFGYYGGPGTNRFKVMVRRAEWKYIYMANGGKEQLFNIQSDPYEVEQRIDDSPDVAEELKQTAVSELMSHPGTRRAVAGGGLLSFPFKPRPCSRTLQFDRSIGVNNFTVTG